MAINYWSDLPNAQWMNWAIDDARQNPKAWIESRLKFNQLDIFDDGIHLPFKSNE